MRNKTWRREIDFYRFRHEGQLRYTDIDTERHINNVAVLTLHAETRSRFHLSLFGREAWLDMTATVRSIGVDTDFLRITHYPETVQVGLNLIEVAEDSYTLATGMFQHGACVGIQETRVGAWRNGERIALPDLVRDRLLAYGVVKEPAV